MSRSVLYIFTTVLFLQSCGGEEKTSDKESDSEPPVEEQGDSEEDLLQTYADDGDTLIYFQEAFIHPQDYEEIALNLNNGKARVLSQGTPIDSGTYTLERGLLSLDLISQSAQLIYEWSLDESGNLDLKQRGSQQVIRAEVEIK